MIRFSIMVIDIVFLLIGAGCLLIGVPLQIKWHRLWEKEGIRHTKKKTPEKLSTSGLYQYVRHPHYLSNILLTFGSSMVAYVLLDLSFPLYILPFLPSILLIPVFILGAVEEERHLTEKFGDEYRSYQNRVPMFIPRVRLAKEASPSKINK